jgi:protein farnesyltransferase subunit beta
MYAWFMSLKQPDGSFTVSAGGEVDVRGTYCLLVVAALLDLLTPELAAGVPAALASCQTHEGGFASASQPSFAPGGALLPAPRPPLGEAHGGYTFCAAAAWALLRPYTRALPEAARPRLNTRALERWLAQMQGGAPDRGGFRGRTNKLVDGCYAWWVGGAFGLLGALGDGGAPAPELLDRGALQEFVLLACQGAAGGLRDKPSKYAYARLCFAARLTPTQARGRVPHPVLPVRPRRRAARGRPGRDAARAAGGGVGAVRARARRATEGGVPGCAELDHGHCA